MKNAVIVNLTLPPEDAAFLDRLAEQLCNTRAGAARLAIREFRKAKEGDKPKEERKPEEAAA